MIDIRYVKSPSSRRHIPTTHTPGNYVLLKSISSKNVSLLIICKMVRIAVRIIKLRKFF